MKATLVKSIVTLVVVVALGAGVTFAQLTSNQVTIGTSALTSGEANLKLCHETGANNWRLLINPGLVLADLVPGDPERELTLGKIIYAGNDNGELDDIGDIGCDTYFDAAGSSDIEMKLEPKIFDLVCDDVSLEDDMRVRFKIGDTFSATKTLAAWETNTTNYGDKILPGEAKKVEIWGKLDNDVELQDDTCSFDVQFTGEQV